MNFNGAVLVDNKRIISACDNYLQENFKYYQMCWDGVTSASKSVEDWGMFAKWWYDADKKGNFEAWKDRYVAPWKLPSEYLFLQGFISEDVKAWLHTDYWLEWGDCEKCLRKLANCGEDVYLAPYQAEFVNRFYKEEK